MDGEVAEEQHIPCFGGTGGGLLNRILFRGQMGTALMNMIIRPVFKTSRNHPEAPLFDRSIIEMDDSDNHSMIFVREIEIVLVHRERDAPFRRLDEHLRVVLRIGPDNICGVVGQSGNNDKSSEDRTVKLHVVAVH